MTTKEHNDASTLLARRHGRFGLFLAIITVGFVVSGFGERWASVIGITTSALLAIVAYRNARVIHDGRWVAALCVSTLVASAMFLLIGSDSRWSAVPMFLQAAMLSALVALTVAASIRRRHVDIQAILAAISAYVLIGLVYAWTYLALDVLDEDQFSMASSDPEEYFSFSFVVQTTLGFGNQVPTASFASRVVVTQAVIGQIFLVTFVARLVSLYGGSREQDEDEQ